ncbi:MAG: efflux RND transporter permease subunit, partial [Coxiellaceae bacterium]|nr:efflux RND transporter permease subunit [Coxiellaceae bacterium]
MKRIPLLTNEAGNVVRLEDVATVKIALQSPPSNMVVVNDEPAVVVAARIMRGQKIDNWSDGVNAVVKQFEQQLPSNLKVTQFFDQTEYTTLRLNSLRNSLLMGAIFVAAVLLVTLGYRAAIIVTLVLPLVLLTAVATLNYMDYALHQISIIGLIVALGLVVDNAIVIVSAMQRRIALGDNIVDAIEIVVRHYWV